VIKTIAAEAAPTQSTTLFVGANSFAIVIKTIAAEAAPTSLPHPSVGANSFAIVRIMAAPAGEPAQRISHAP
jgi:hypothetical protein